MYKKLKTVFELYAHMMESTMAMIDASQEEHLWHGKAAFETVWFEELEDFKENFLELIRRYGISPGALEEAYFRKNQINHQRQINGY